MIKLFTHTDLDGYGCSLVAHYYLGAENLDVAYCVYGKQKNSLDYRLIEFMDRKEYEKFDLVLITDLSPSDDVAEMIQQTMPDKVLMFDHHDSAVHLMTERKYPWARVETQVSLEKIFSEDGYHASSAAWLLSEFFQSPAGKTMVSGVRGQSVPRNEFLSFIVEKIRRYDTWEWKKIYNDEKAGELNMLFYLYGGKTFVTEFLSRCYLESSIPSDDGMFNDNEKFFIKWDLEKTNRIIGSISTHKVHKMDFFGHKAAIAFSDTHASELGNMICERHTDVDIAVIISLSLKTVSLRASKDGIHLGEFAKMFGGGGHPQAAGLQFDESVSVKIIETIMTEMLWKQYNNKTSDQEPTE